MKRLALLISVIISTSYLLNAQWEFQNPVPSNAELNDVFFADSIHGWAVGENSTILHTFDGGDNWQVQLSNFDTVSDIQTEFLSVCFTDINNGWAVGWEIIPFGEEYGIIYHTNDGGDNWTLQYSLPGNLNTVYFTNTSTGWAVGTDQFGGAILHTIDSGNSWTIQYNDTATSYFWDVCFVDEINGWVIGDGVLLNTTDSGASWNSVTIDTNKTSIRSVWFTDINNGWIAGYSDVDLCTIFHTSDGGITWLMQASDGITFFEKVYFHDQNCGWVLTSSSWPKNKSTLSLHQNERYVEEYILSTKDGGKTWSFHNFGITNGRLQGLHFINSDIGWVVGNNGQIHKTEDAGYIWESNGIHDPLFNLYDVFFVDHNNGWAVGGWPAIYEQPIIMNTNDGGVSWELQSTQRFGIGFTSVFFTDASNGWAVGWNSWSPSSVIFQTINGGDNWEEVYFEDGYFSDIFFTSNGCGWVVGSEGIILHTTDQGINWETQTSGVTEGLNSVCFINQDIGWIVGDGRVILHTSDGGNNWDVQSFVDEGMLSNVHFIDSENGWAVGEWEIIPNIHYDIIHTIDGGQSWADITPSTNIYPINNVYFFDNLHGWAVGNHGTMFYTDDGGITWKNQASGTQENLRAIDFTDPSNGWVAGNSLTILHTNNGGAVGIQEPSHIISSTFPANLYPNPFTTSTTIEYELTYPETVRITFYNQFGKQVDVIEQKQLEGLQQVIWTPENLAEGIYYFRIATGRLQAGEKSASGKLVLVR